MVHKDFPINRKLEKYRIPTDRILGHYHRIQDYPAVPVFEFQGLDFLTIGEDSDLRARLIAMFAECGLQVNIIHRLEQMSTCYFMAAAGYGAAILRAPTLDFVSVSPDLCLYRPKSELSRRTYQFYAKKSLFRTKATRAFLDFIREKGIRSGIISPE